MSFDESQDNIGSIAIIGMAGRFPGAKNVDEFWRNLRDGVESISTFTDEELLAYGIDAELLKLPNYVRARGAVEGVEWFDAGFFNVSPREAEIMDPQLRLFLENAWEAVEHAGYDTENYAGTVGVFGGMSWGQYLMHNILPSPDVVAAAGALQLRILNDRDFLTTLVSYKLNFKGPTVNVQTACSTSLVAVHLACQSLLGYQCDMALAGGVSLLVPQKSGYLPQEGVFSPDGHCRAFDAAARGTVSGSGVGAVILKRLSEAVEDGDVIHAVIRGSAINNDGADKVGYTAPSVDGQAEVIALAQATAGVEPETISYIEAHGTGTPMGDPIEIAALSQVFQAGTEKKQFCAVGSVKTNVGHSDAAAGVTSLIKTVLALKHGQIPPSLHFNQPNPQIDFDNSPFFVNSGLSEWPAGGSPRRRAGVSSFAIGGTNAHVIVEEAPEGEPPGVSRPWQLVVLSAKSEAALETASDNLVDFLKRNRNLNPADVAYTLQIGRRAFAHRRTLVCRDVEDLTAALETRDPKRVFTGPPPTADRPVAFMFPGLGNHYVDMGWELYRQEKPFREEVDLCCDLLKEHLGSDLRDVMYPDWKNRVAAEAPGAAATRGGSGLDLRQMLGRGPQEDEDARRLSLTVFSQPALFVIEYALARLWMRWGISPQSLIGYSIGEYVAACLSGVFSLEDALMLVARRARMIQELPGGAMLAVSLPAEEVEPLLGRHLSISAINGPHVCVVSGATEAADELEEDLTRRGVVARRLQATHAFHSGMMEPIVEPFTELVGTVKLNPPNVPLISNVTGTWLTPAQATDPRYWATHLSQPVRFGDGIQELWRVPGRVLLEVGPGQALGAWAMQHPQSAQVEGRVILSSLRHSYDRQSDQSFLLNTLGRLWQAGLQVNWTEFYAGERRRRVPLPSYPFERQRYWVEPPRQERDSPREARPATLNKKNYIADWFYLPIWKQSKPPAASARADSADGAARRYLVFVDEAGVGARLVEQLKQAGRDVLTVRAGERFDKLDENTFVVNPGRGQDFGDLFGQLKQRQRFPQVICHMWGVTPPQDGHGAGVELAERHQEVCFYSLLSLAQALGDHGFNNPLRLMVVTDGVHSIGGAEAVYPAKALTLGPCRVIPQEYPHIDCQSVDVVVPQAGTRQAEILTSQLLAELAADASDATVAYRGSHRWLQTFEPIRLDEAPGEKTLLREKGVYLITGGVGGIGLTLAEHLARTARARLVLTGRSAFPQRSEWASWLAARGADDEVSRKIKKLQELESLGAEVLVLDADVTSQTQMERVVSQTHERFGKIDGVIHAAGVAPGGMIQLKTPEAAARVLAPKVRGTLVLDAVLKNEQPDFLILCSSLNAFVGALGLVDHCAANAFLDAYAESSATHNRTHTVSINWDGWLDVGQAAHASLSKGLRQILEAAHSAAGAHPLLDKLLVDEPEQKIHSTELSAGRHWVLAEHRLLGDSVLPGTGYIEMVRAAFAAHAGDKTIHMRKVFFLTPLILKGSEVKEVRIIFTKNEEGFSFRVISRAAGAAAAEAPWQEHAKGRIASLDDDSAGEFPLAETLARLNPQELEVIKAERIKLRAETSAPEPEAEFKDFGPRWQNLVRRIGVGDGEAIAYLELPEEFVDDLQTLGLHPALMDAATGFVQIAGEGSYLPLAYESIKIRAPLPKHLYSYAKFGGTSAGRKDVLVSDLVITDVHGNRLIEIGEYTLKRVTSPAVFGAAADNGSAGADTTHATAPPETRKHEGPSAHVETGTSVIAEGILPKEGAEAFGRILRSGLSVARIAVATRELGALIERSRAQNSESILEEVNNLQPLRQKHARPNLAVAYAAPRTEVEKKLAHIWRELLAVEEVGVHDSFFDMGGDSLLATMLIGRVSEALNVDLPLRTLFAAPTVAELALAITQKQAEQVDSDALMELLTNIKNLSKDEVKAMLSAEKQGNG